MRLTLEQRRAKQAAQFDRLQTQNVGSRQRLIRKQVSEQRHWLAKFDTVDQEIRRERVDQLVERAAREISALRSGYPRMAFGWSGGKDSLALQVVCNTAGIDACVFVLTELEYPEFLQWATDRMPDSCEVINTGLDLYWLRDHLDMLFPPDAQASGKWFSKVQHTGQRQYFNKHGLDLMLLGRRRLDGNLIGRDGMTTSQRGRFFNPIRDWTHEETLACIKHHELELPPIYQWPRGYQVGTGPWPARQFCRSVEHGYAEVYEIDSSIVRDAAEIVPSARDWLARNG